MKSEGGDMHSTMTEPRSAAPLEATSFQSPFALDTILDHSTWLARRLSKKKLKLLTRIEAKVRTLLEDGERVRYVTFGSTVSFWESYFLGWMMIYVNRRAILLTDRRVILLQIDSRRRPRHLVSQVRYASIRKVRRTLLGSTRITLDDGKTFVFAYIPKRDRKFLQRLTDWIDASITRDGGGWEDLCPHCYTATAGRPRMCEACGGRIKSARKAGFLSLLFPGLGDIYLGHWKFAIMEILVAGFLWLSLLVPDPEYPLDAVGLVVFAGFMFAFVHGVDAVGTAYIARKGLYPAGRS
jgi:hypothetical protein